MACRLHWGVLSASSQKVLEEELDIPSVKVVRISVQGQPDGMGVQLQGDKLVVLLELALVVEVVGMVRTGQMVLDPEPRRQPEKNMGMPN